MKVTKWDEVKGPPVSLSEGDSMRLPPPKTFAEGQRLVYGLLAAAAGIFCGLCAIAMIALLMWGSWSAGEEHSSKPLIKGANMRSKHALPMLALALSACASKTTAVQPIAALAEQRHCPAYPLPPAELLKPLVKTDFLTPIG